MENQQTPVSSRRDFLSAVAVTAASAGLASLNMPAFAGVPPQAHAPGDPEAWINRIHGTHKMVFDVPHPNGIYPFGWPRVFLLTNMATGAAENDCCGVVIFRHTAIPYAFDHNMWQKYQFGEIFDIHDENKKALTRNPFWQPPKGAFKLPGLGEVEVGINDLMKSGIMFGVCSMAMMVFSNTVAGKMNMKAEDVMADWERNLIPGVQTIPSGIWGLGRAQEKGCAYVFAGYA